MSSTGAPGSDYTILQAIDRGVSPGRYYGYGATVAQGATTVTATGFVAGDVNKYVVIWGAGQNYNQLAYNLPHTAKITAVTPGVSATIDYEFECVDWNVWVLVADKVGIT